MAVIEDTQAGITQPEHWITEMARENARKRIARTKRIFVEIFVVAALFLTLFVLFILP